MLVCPWAEMSSRSSTLLSWSISVLLFFFFLWKNTSSSQIVVVSESWVWTSNYVQLFKFKKCRYFILSFGYWILHLPFYLCLKYIGIQFLNNSLNFCRLCSDISCPFFHSFFFSYHCERKVKVLIAQSWLSATPWSVARQAPLAMEFCRQEYWSGLPFLSPGDLPDPGISPIQGSNPGILHCRQILYDLSQISWCYLLSL